MADGLIGDLFLPADSQQTSAISKIAQYHGVGSLEGWLRVVITRKKIDRVRACRRQVPIEDLDSEPDVPRAGSTASGLVQQGERRFAVSAVKQALESALNQLNDGERLVLELYFLREVNLKSIARLLNIHESTASRHVKQICRKLQKGVERNLRDKFRVRPQEIREVIRKALSEDEIDLKNMFAESAQ